MNSLAQLTDASLHSETKRLAGKSNALTAQLLAHLGEVEARGIHRERACSSLAVTPRGPQPRSMYCVYELRMSEDEAQRRCRVARLARQFPILLEMLAEASLHLTGILLLGPHLTVENCAELLARARFRTKREIERLVAELAPSPDVPSKIVPLRRAGAEDWTVSPLDEGSPGFWAPPRNTWAAYVRALAGGVRQLEAGLGAGQAPPRASNEQAAAAMGWQAANSAAYDSETGTRTPVVEVRSNVTHKSTPVVGSDALPRSAPGDSQPTASVPPVAELRYKVQFTVDQAYVELLEEARNLLQHQLPTRDLVEVQRRALELLVHKLRQRKYAARERPRPKAPEPVKGTLQTPPRPKSTDARAPAPQPATRALDSAPRSAKSANHAPHSAPQSANQSRYIPAEVRRSVWTRDEARCAYVDARGQRCREQAGLEFHHQHLHARCGPPSIDNLALRCRSHNTLAAEQDFGRDLIRKRRARRATLAESNRAGAAP